MDGSSSVNVCIAMDPNRERRLGPLFVLGGHGIIPTAPTHRTFQAQCTEFVISFAANVDLAELVQCAAARAARIMQLPTECWSGAALMSWSVRDTSEIRRSM